MGKPNKGMGVRAKMLWIFLPAVLIPLLLFGTLMFYSSYAELEQSSTKTYTQMTAQVGAVFSEYISRVDQTNRTVDKLDEITLFLREDFTSVEMDSDRRVLLESQAMDGVAQLAHTNDGLYAFTVATLDGEQLSYVLEKPDRAILPLTDSYYDRLRNSTSQTVILPVRQSQYMFTPEEPVFTVAYKYIDIPDGINMYTGYVISECPVSRLEQICRNVDMGPGSRICILDQDYGVAYSSAGEAFGESLSAQLKNGRAQGRVNLNNQDCLLVSTRLKDTGWTVVATIPYGVITQQTTQLLSIFLILCLLCAVIMVTVIIVQSGSFTRPISQLQKAMKTVSKGDMTVRIQEKRTDEFGELNEGFNRLIGELDTLITHISESKERENLAKYQMLQSQINPHFLYNTLESIRMMAVLRDEEEISEALISLSKLFRYCIRQGDRLVTVREELEQAKNYLFLQSFRYQDRLKVIYEVDEQVLDRQMPKVLLQPLLENAFAHGLRDWEKMGIITITVSQVQGGTAFAIHDNGCGIDRETLAGIRLKLEHGGAESIGLANVNERLRLYYKSTQGLQIESMPGEGTTVSFTIPCDQRPTALLNYAQHSEMLRKEDAAFGK